MKRFLVIGLGLSLSMAGLHVRAESAAQDVLKDLKAKTASDSFYFAWTHMWMTPWPDQGDQRHLIETDGKVRPKPVDEIELKEGIAEGLKAFVKKPQVLTEPYPIRKK